MTVWVLPILSSGSTYLESSRFSNVRSRVLLSVEPENVLVMRREVGGQAHHLVLLEPVKVRVQLGYVDLKRRKTILKYTFPSE